MVNKIEIHRTATESAGAEGGAKERALMKANAKQEKRTKESARRVAE